MAQNSPSRPPVRHGKTPLDFGGAYHDNGSLVVNPTAVRLPPVCLKTGVNTRDTYRLEDQFLAKSKRIWASLLGGAVGYSIAKKCWGQPITLVLPLSNDWMQNASRKSRSSWIGVAVAAGFLILGLMLSIFHGVFAILGLFGMIFALIIAYLKGKSADAPFRISSICNGWIWIEGVKPEVAASFPPLPSGGSGTSTR